MINKKDQLKYWNTVNLCLQKFHNLSFSEANREVKHRVFLLTQEGLLTDESADLVFHEEPFAVACDITKTRLDLKKNLKAYKDILDFVDSQQPRARISMNALKVLTQYLAETKNPFAPRRREKKSSYRSSKRQYKSNKGSNKIKTAAADQKQKPKHSTA